MKVNPLNLIHQGPVLLSLANVAVKSLAGIKTNDISKLPAFPGTELKETIPPIDNSLVNDYIKHIGGDFSSYKNSAPFHLFPQWCFPILGRTLDETPLDMVKVINAGVTVGINGEIPRDTSLTLRARIEKVEITERRAIITQRVITGTEKNPDIIVVELRTFLPLKAKDPNSEKTIKKEKPSVPDSAREIGKFKVNEYSGLEFGILTGDMNPLHWIPAYAQSAGHKRPILHGFSTIARTVEILNRNHFAGDVKKLKSININFNKPLYLPGEAKVFIDSMGGIYVGDAVGAPTYLSGVIS